MLILMEERRENKKREEGLERMEVGMIDRLSTRITLKIILSWCKN